MARGTPRARSLPESQPQGTVLELRLRRRQFDRELAEHLRVRVERVAGYERAGQFEGTIQPRGRSCGLAPERQLFEPIDARGAS
jgi:hypothetical protein